MGEGVLENIDEEEKLSALRCLMLHYATDVTLSPQPFDSAVLRKTAILRLTVHSLSAKRHIPRG